MIATRQKLTYSVYLVAVVLATAGWMWALLEGAEWLFGA